jgi:uroporphyrinogen decarboxylase
LGVPVTYVEEILDASVCARITKAIEFEEPDRVPIWDYIDNWRAIEHFAGREANLLKANVRAYHGLGIDLCRGFGTSYRPETEGSAIVEGGLERRISGLTLWNNPPLKSIGELVAYHVDPPTDDEIEEYVESNRRYCEAFAPYTMWVPGCNVGFDIYYSITGLRLFSIAKRLIPEELRRIMAERNALSLEYAKAMAREKLSPLFFIGEDIAYKNKLMFPLDYLRAEFIPLLEKICRPLNDANIRVIFHSDGYLPDDLIDSLIEAGVDGLNPIEPLAGMDIAHLKGEYYGKLILVGNLDCSQVLPLSAGRNVAEETKKLICSASAGGGHFIGSSSEITPSTPLENIMAFYNTARRYGRYPVARIDA